MTGLRRIFVVAVLVCSAPFVTRRPSVLLAQEELAVGSKAPFVEVTDLDGKLVRVGHVLGKRAAVVEFWATWCELCKALMPSMEAAKAKYGDRVDFYGVNVTVNESKDRVRRYVAEHHPPFVTLFDATGTAVRAFSAPATSYVVIVDKSGIVRYIGSGPKQDIPAELAKALAK